MEFKKIRLGDHITIKNGCAFKGKDFTDKGVPVLKIKNIKPNKILVDELSYITKEKVNEKYKINKNDVIITMTGNRIEGTPDSWVGKVALFDLDGEYYLNQRLSILTPNKEIDSRFLAYLLSSWKYQLYFIQRATSSGGQANISPSIINDLEIEIPQKNNQIKIANIISNINNKIKENIATNNNLLELALTLFKEFMKQNKDSSEKIYLKDCVEKIGTGADAIQRAPIVDYDTGIRCIRVGDMTNNRKYYEWGFTEMTGKDFENYKLELGDIVVTRTAVNGITKIIDDNERIVCNNGLIRLKVNNKYNPIYIYMCTKTKDFYDYIHRIDSETSVRPNMKVGYFTSYQIDKISLEKQNEFCNKIDPMLKLQKELEQEIHNLEQLRNTLLPKLMNGEIDLDNIEI